MKLLKGEPHQCMLASFAMAFDCSLKDIIDFIGHDGSAIMFPGLEGVEQMRSFHPQEFIDFGKHICKAVVAVEPSPRIQYYPVPLKQNRLGDWLTNTTGVLGLETHAVAWNGRKVFDPAGRVYKIDKLKEKISWFWAVIDFQNQ